MSTSGRPARKPTRADPTCAGPTCADVARHVRALDREPGVEPRDPRLVAAREHLAGCAPCRRRHRGTVASLEGLAALRERQVPGGILDGLYDAVCARAAGVPAGGGMSPAFLDAPRALRVWRATALAASLLLAVGVGLVAGRGSGPAGAGGPGMEDLRPRILRPLDGSGRTAWSEVQALPVYAPAPRGDAGFFDRAPAVRPVADEGPVRPRWN